MSCRHHYAEGEESNSRREEGWTSLQESVVESRKKQDTEPGEDKTLDVEFFFKHICVWNFFIL